jgi:hypothetical protein
MGQSHYSDLYFPWEVEDPPHETYPTQSKCGPYYDGGYQEILVLDA